MHIRQWLVAGLLGFCCTWELSAQHMTSVSVTPGVMIPVHTARTHLTVLDLDSPIEDLAVENTGFDIQWRGHTVFILPKGDQATNLFVWTKAGRVVYELLAPAATIQNMDVSVDTHFPPKAPAARLSAAPVSVTDSIPSDLLVRAQAVALESPKIRQHSSLLISDVYRCQDRLFLRYQVRNNGSTNLKLDENPVVTAGFVSRAMTTAPLQLRPEKAANITTGAPLPLIASETGTSSLAPGQTSGGIVGVHIPLSASPLAIRVAVPSSPTPLHAMVVIP